jgi:hypothetical protein
MHRKLTGIILGVATAVALAATSASAHGDIGNDAAAPREAQAPQRYAVIRGHLFRVMGAGRTLSLARYVLDRQGGTMSCFTEPPLSVQAGRFVAARLRSREGRYVCFEGREPLEQLALQKKLLPATAPAARGDPNLDDEEAREGGPLAAAIAAPKLLVYDEEVDEWTEEDQSLVDSEFWGEFIATGLVEGTGDPSLPGSGAGGPQCMARCSAALSVAARFCGVVPPQIQSVCLLGAGGLYVTCIATC